MTTRAASVKGSAQAWRTPLLALNFFMADMQAGIGPFLGVFLMAYGWKSGLIGTVMTLGGVAGMIATIPAGALIDASPRKRLLIVVSGIATVLASAIILLSQQFWVVAGSQVATAIAGAAVGPGVAGITLGIVRQKGFNRQNGLNQASNHAGIRSDRTQFSCFFELFPCISIILGRDRFVLDWLHHHFQPLRRLPTKTFPDVPPKRSARSCAT